MNAKIFALLVAASLVASCGSSPSDGIDKREGASQVYLPFHNPFPYPPDTINDLHATDFHKSHFAWPIAGGLAVPMDKQAYYWIAGSTTGDPNVRGTNWTFQIHPEVPNVNPWRTGDITTQGAMNCNSFTMTFYTDDIEPNVFDPSQAYSISGFQGYWANPGTVICTAYVYKMVTGHSQPVFLPVTFTIPPDNLIFFTIDENAYGWSGTCRDPLPPATGCNNAWKKLGVNLYAVYPDPGVPLSVPMASTLFSQVY
jgi:hypothetical protein